MIKISNTNALMPQTPPKMKDNHDHNERVRRRNLRKVYRENAWLSQRLQNIKPTYPNANWDRVGASQVRAKARLGRNRTLGFLSPERWKGPFEGGDINSGLDGRSEQHVDSGLFGYNLDSVEGSHLWEGPSTEQNGKRRRGGNKSNGRRGGGGRGGGRSS